MGSSITLDPEFQSLIPPLSPNELAQLEANIVADGCRDPLVTWNGILLDGHNRHEICARLGLPFATSAIELADRNEAIEWIIRNQFGRRNLVPFVRAELAMRLEPIIVARAKANQGKRTDLNIPQNSWESEQQAEIDAIWADSGLTYDAKRNMADAVKLSYGKKRRNEQRSADSRVYVATTASKIKIGVSADPLSRVEQLRTSDPEIRLIDHFPGGRSLEKAAIKRFSAETAGGEWLKFSESLLKKVTAYIKRESSRENESKKELAKAAGLSHDTIAKAKKIAAEATDEVKAALRSGETSINAEYKKLTVHVGNNSGQNEWYTPPAYIEAARAVLGEIDCDPASSEIANRTVGAKAFFTAETDGLKQTWGKRVWMNPPYAQPLVANFADAITDKYAAGEVSAACVLVNNATETGWFQKMLEGASSVCLLSGRVKFIDPTGKPSGAPLQGQAVLYFGEDGQRFASEFSKLGRVLHK